MRRAQKKKTTTMPPPSPPLHPPRDSSAPYVGTNYDGSKHIFNLDISAREQIKFNYPVVVQFLQKNE